MFPPVRIVLGLTWEVCGFSEGAGAPLRFFDLVDFHSHHCSGYLLCLLLESLTTCIGEGVSAKE